MENLKDYVVVEFTETCEVATVYKLWLEKRSEKWVCYWPEKDPNKLAVNRVEADKSNWGLWEIRILSSSDIFKDARRMEKKAEFTSDINSELEKPRSRKRPKKYIDTSCSEDFSPKKKKTHKTTSRKKIVSSSESESDIPTPTKLPSPMKPVKPASKPNRSLFLKSPATCASTTPTPNTLQSDMFLSPTPSSSHTNSVDRDTIISTPEPTNQMSQFLTGRIDRLERAVQRMSYDIKEILEMQHSILKAVSGQNTPKIDALSKEYLDFERRFPLQHVEDLQELDSSLENEDIQKLLVELLKQIGGVSLDDSVRRICIRLFTNEVASHFSWEGRKGKLALNNLTLTKTIGRVLSSGHHKAEFTFKAFEFRMREWFRQAKSRISGKKVKDATPTVSHQREES